MNMNKPMVSLCAAVMLPVLIFASPGFSQTNLLPNGGLEKDSNKDGVPDGWLGNPSHFSSETLEQVQTYIANLPSHEQLLKGKEIRASDGWVITSRGEDGNWSWGDYVKSAQLYRRLGNEYLPNNSRFGRLPVPEGLELGGTTLVVHNLRPHEQTISEPIRVKPNTGYRLSYWFRLSGSANDVTFHILGADGQVISGINLGWSHVAYWTRREIEFRTGPKDTTIQLRPWTNFRNYYDHRRAWYDDFRLVEDNSVRLG
ncbi:hypothetical protein LCGC14_2332060, partial [marine sediment metagenome]